MTAWKCQATCATCISANRWSIVWESSGSRRPVAAESCHSAMALIEGRLFMMFRMLESGGFDELVRASRQLNDEAITLGFQDVARHAGVLTNAIVKRRGKQAVLEALEDVIDACTGATA